VKDATRKDACCTLKPRISTHTVPYTIQSTKDRPAHLVFAQAVVELENYPEQLEAEQLESFMKTHGDIMTHQEQLKTKIPKAMQEALDSFLGNYQVQSQGLGLYKKSQNEVRAPLSALCLNVMNKQADGAGSTKQLLSPLKPKEREAKKTEVADAQLGASRLVCWASDPDQEKLFLHSSQDMAQMAIDIALLLKLVPDPTKPAQAQAIGAMLELMCKLHSKHNMKAMTCWILEEVVQQEAERIQVAKEFATVADSTMKDLTTKAGQFAKAGMEKLDQASAEVEKILEKCGGLSAAELLDAFPKEEAKTSLANLTSSLGTVDMLEEQLGERFFTDYAKKIESYKTIELQAKATTAKYAVGKVLAIPDTFHPSKGTRLRESLMVVVSRAKEPENGLPPYFDLLIKDDAALKEKIEKASLAC